MEDNNIVASILGELSRNITPIVRENAKIVDEFVAVLREELKKCQGILSKAHVMHGGSAYESLAVSVKTDFDVAIILPAPYVAEYFKVVRDPSQFFKLLKLEDPKTSDIPDGFLDAARLQSQLFAELNTCVRRVRVPGVRKVEWQAGLAAFTLEIITTSGTIISVDLVPQIAAREWSEHLRQLEQLPRKLQEYVKILMENASNIYFFSPAVPGEYANKNFLFNISFSMLEKEFLRSDPNIRDIVRLMKLVGEARGWPHKYGLKSFCIKRLALKFSDDLLHKPVWDGYKALLKHLYEELNVNHGIDGYFTHGLDAYNKDPEKIKALCCEISEVYRWTSPLVYTVVKEHIGC